jgi:hypothetical protein
VFSYLDTIKEIVNPGVYQRGLKYYLDGKVTYGYDLVLDFWRVYEVSGSDYYKVKIPLLHLALNPKKYKLASQALEESVSCDCEYFLSWGVCKHIVGVCAALEQEFSLSLKKTKQNFASNDQDSGIKQIFAAQEEKQERLILQAFEEYLIKPNYRLLDNYLRMASDLVIEGGSKEQLPGLHLAAQKALRKYEHEESLIPLIVQQIATQGKFWFEFWQKLWPEISRERQNQIWFDLYMVYSYGVFNDLTEEIIANFKSLDLDTKKFLFNQIQDQYPDLPEQWIDLCMVIEYWPGLQTYLAQIDPLTLIQIAVIWPDKQEDVEELLLSRVRPYLEFLPAGEYTEVVEVFKKWQTVLGRSVYFEEALKLAKELHPKKRGLLKKLEMK